MEVKSLNKEQIEVLKKLVKIGTEYDVDQTYVLYDIERVLNGKQYKLSDIKFEDYV